MLLIYSLVILSFAWQSVLTSICMEDHCQFELTIRQRRSMTYTAETGVTYNVAWNTSEGELQVVENSLHKAENHDIIGEFVSDDDVITTDGYTRNIYIVNEQFPGPALEVLEGAQVTVRVRNLLHTEVVTIHWHGFHMRNNLWMDGVGHLTQCPIQPGQSFEYKFEADTAGTFFYHGHFRNTRIDGIYGAFIVHRQVPSIPYHVVTMQDWFHTECMSIRVMNPHDPLYQGSGEASLYELDRDYSVDGNQVASMRYDSTLIDGRGRRDEENEPLPLSTYDVISGSRYRFHVIHAGSEHSYEMMIDSHKMNITAMDGYEIETVAVDSFIIAPGERIDFEIQTEVNPNSFWIRAETIRQGVGLPIVEDGVIKGTKAILRYDNISNGDPTSERRVCSEEEPCIVFNCPYLGYRDDQYKTCLTMNDAHSTASDAYLQSTYGVDDTDYDEYFLNWGFNFGSSINGRRFAFPSAPFSGDSSNSFIPCDDELCEQGCYCTYIMDLEYNRTIQLVISNLQDGASFMAHHVVHLHGHSFVVLKTGFPSYDPNTGLWEQENDDVMCDSDICAHPSWNGSTPELNDKGVIRDTFTVPARGYAVLRFRSDNPGFWILHCHQESHVEEGMAIVFNEAEGMHPQVPNNFPTCTDFQWDIEKTFAEDNGKETSLSENDIPTNQAQYSEDDYVRIQPNVAIGVCFGLVALGAVIASLPIMVYMCFISTQSMKKNAVKN